MKEIQLSKRGKKNSGQFVALIDDEDIERVNQFSWSVFKRRKSYYAERIFCINGQMTNVGLHRYILGDKCNKKYIDHIDRNPLNCQKYNLRICTVGQNNSNRATYSKTKYKGCYISGKKFLSTITVNKVVTQLGRYDTDIEAAQVYDRAAIKAFGEFACLNFPGN